MAVPIVPQTIDPFIHKAKAWAAKASLTTGKKLRIHNRRTALRWIKGTLTSTGLVALAVAVGIKAEVALLILGAMATWGGMQFKHYWQWVAPLHAALKMPLQLDDSVKAGKYIKIPRNYTKKEKVGKVYLPPHFTGIDTNTVARTIQNKLGITDCTVGFKLAGRKPYAEIRQTPRPPGKVTFSSWQMQVDKSPESAPLLGIGPNGKQVKIDLDAESPHVLVSASTGGGKSVITRTATSQLLHNGGQMVVLDFKRHSHKWAKDLCQVIYCREIEEIHDALVELGKEGHRRNLVVDDWEGDEKDAPVGPRLAILVEEANATIAKLKRYWTSIRVKGDPKESPAIDALREVLFMGRAVKMHVLLVAQSATAAALGGPEVRECFAVRILARYTVNAWKMLVPEVHPIPRSTRHVGRAQVVLGGVATETQVLFMTAEEARRWASSGVQAPPPDLSRDIAYALPTRENAVTSHDIVTPELTLIKGGRVSLAQAARDRVVPMSADALRQAKRRDAAFPQAGDDGKWEVQELIDWYGRRGAKSA